MTTVTAGPDAVGSFIVAFVDGCGDSWYACYRSPLAACDAAEAWSGLAGGVSEIYLWPINNVLRRYVDGCIDDPPLGDDGLDGFIRGWYCLDDLDKRIDELGEQQLVYGERSGLDVPF